MKLLTAAEEHDLVQRLYARDENAMRYFYVNYRSSLLYTIQRLVRHPEVAEDVLQEAMLKFWVAFPSYDPEKARLFTWALTICRNLAIDTLRLQRRARETTSTLTAELAAGLEAPPTFKPDHIGVRQWLDLVATSDRPLLEALYVQGYTQAETAERLGLPLGTVKTRSRRLIQQLALLLSDEQVPT